MASGGQGGWEHTMDDDVARRDAGSNDEAVGVTLAAPVGEESAE